MHKAAPNYYPALDGLRAVAVLAVMLHHYFTHFLLMAPGWASVDVFFVLSGFLITGILYDSRDRRHRFRDFYMRRVLRIFPLYYGIWLLLLVTTPLLQWEWRPLWALWPVHLGNYIPFLLSHPRYPSGYENLLSAAHFGSFAVPALSLGHFWSLCVEEQFYLVWPTIVFLVRRRSTLLVTSIVIAAAVLLARIVLLFTLPEVLLGSHFLKAFTPVRVDAFMYGGVLALLLRGERERAWLSQHRQAVCRSVYGGCALCTGVFVGFYGVRAISVVNPWVTTVGFSLIDLFAAIVVLDAITPGTVVFRVLDLRVLRWLGGISYGVYVLHDLLHSFYVHVIGKLGYTGRTQTVLTFLLALPCTLLLAQLSYTFYEKPFLRLKSRFASQTHTAPVVAPDAESAHA